MKSVAAMCWLDVQNLTHRAALKKAVFIFASEAKN
jgi:hypothetical protein